MFFNNVVIRGYRLCPVDPKTYLYVQKCVNSLWTEFPVSKIAVFYEKYFNLIFKNKNVYYLYSDLPQDQVEIIHKYLFLNNYSGHEGYQVGKLNIYFYRRIGQILDRKENWLK